MPCHTPRASHSPQHFVIESTQNATIKALSLLKNRRQRDREQRYLIEGVREVSRAVAGWAQVLQIIFCPALLSSEVHLPEGIDRLELSQRAFEKLSLRQNPDGLMALASMQEHVLEPHVADDAIILVLDNLEKPGNIGALLRTADAVAVNSVILTGDKGTDMYNPNLIRASMGSVFSRPVLHIPQASVMAWLEAQQITCLATSPAASQSYWQCNLQGKVALILGNEAEGLGSEWLEQTQQQVSIPMLSQPHQGQADSLNVATAGALLLYEALRQRQI